MSAATSFLTIPSFTVAPALPADPAISYTFPLDIWQQHAVAAIERGDNVLVTAKTGSGKTLVGEYQIAASLRRGGRVFYTTPIKSLTNQKYHDLKHLFPRASVGIMTGDIKSAPEADIVVMTTEILRNLLYKQSTTTATLGTAGALTLERLDAVVFDEVHYINDPDRGHVWEETLILLPPAVHLVLLSATIDSPEAFGEWLGAAKQRPIVLLKTAHRIVPLVHGVWNPAAPKGVLPIHVLKAGDEAVYDGGAYTGWLRGRAADLRAADEWASKVAVAKAAGDSVAGSDAKARVPAFTHQLNHAVRSLAERELLPALFFNFSRAECERHAATVEGSLLDSSETAAVKHIISFHLHRYSETLTHLPQYHQITRLLERGVAFHHSGLLPLLKEVVELLFSKGYVRTLFCTETFAVGLNMPARTVVFLDLKKPCGGEDGGFRPLRADEYIQMAGRAGRRGKDAQGLVIYLPARKPLEPDEMRGVLTGPLVSLESRLHFHYDFVLKALHASSSAHIEIPLWNTVIDASYWSAQRAKYAAEAAREVEGLQKAIDALPLTEAEAAEIATKRSLELTVRSSVNAAKRQAQAALEQWKNRHFGPKWVAAEKAADVRVKLCEKKAAAERLLEAFRTPVENARIVPVLNALEDWGALTPACAATATQTPTLSTFGVLATEVNEGNPLLMARLFESRILHAGGDAEAILAALGAFIVEKEALDKSVHPSALADVPAATTAALLAMDDWCKEGLAIDARYGVDSPPEFWCLATLWVEIGLQWWRGVPAGEIAARFHVYEGNLMRGLLKLANLVNEWITLATYKADVEMLELLKDAPTRLLRDIAQPESLYLRL
jgi:superfamily II RNA helicase